MKNIFIYILIIAVIALAGVLVWQFWPSALSSTPSPTTSPTVTQSPLPLPEETANWEVYRNEEHWFEFKYPINWKVIREEEWNFEIQNKDDANNILEIRTPIEAAGSAFINISFDEDILIADDIPAKRKVKLIELDDYKWWRIIIQWKRKEGGVIIYDYPYEVIESIDYLEIFNKMLSTFKFID